MNHTIDFDFYLYIIILHLINYLIFKIFFQEET